MPSAGTPTRDSGTANSGAHSGRNPEVEEIRDLFKQLMAKSEADAQRSKEEFASNAHAMDELASHVRTLSEKIKAQ